MNAHPCTMLVSAYADAAYVDAAKEHPHRIHYPKQLACTERAGRHSISHLYKLALYTTPDSDNAPSHAQRCRGSHNLIGCSNAHCLVRHNT